MGCTGSTRRHDSLSSQGKSRVSPRDEAPVETEGKLGALAQLNVPLLALRKNGTIVAANASVVAMLGYDHESDVVGRNASVVMPESAGVDNGSFAERFISPRSLEGSWSEASRAGSEVEVRTKSGELIPCILTVSETSGHDGFVAALVDSRSAKRAAAAEAEVAALQRVLDERSEFLSFMSHELRVPLNALALGLEDLEQQAHEACEGLDDARVPTGVRHARLPRGVLDARRTAPLLSDLSKCGQSVLDTVNDMLDIDRLQRNKFVFRDSQTIVVDLIETAMAVCRAASSTRTELVLESHVNAALENLVIWCDRNRILQALNLYLSNAVKYTSGAGRVTLRAELVSGFDGRRVAEARPPVSVPSARTRQPGKRSRISSRISEVSVTGGRRTPPPVFDNSAVLRISVWNDGTELSESACESYFDEFSHAGTDAHHQHVSHTTGARNGLGLSIVKHIVENGHSGNVFVKRELGGITTGLDIMVPSRFADPLELVALRDGSAELSRALHSRTVSECDGDLDKEYEAVDMRELHTIRTISSASFDEISTSSGSGSGSGSGTGGAGASLEKAQSPLSRFIFHDHSPCAAAGNASGSHSPFAQAQTVLYIEDSEINVRMVKRWVNRFGLKFRSAPNGALGVKAIESEAPDLVLMDKYVARTRQTACDFVSHSIPASHEPVAATLFQTYAS